MDIRKQRVNVNKRIVLILVAAMAVGAGLFFLLFKTTQKHAPDQASAASSAASGKITTVAATHKPKPITTRDKTDVAQEEAANEPDEAEEEPSPEEKKEAEEEALVEAFDNLTDKWLEATPKGVQMADVERFVSTFKRVPKDRQDECIHRALNLVPDENVMLLAGVLMDRSVDAEIAETVFGDILNRGEDVKQPILKQVFKDKKHPCWADAAWILDVTGE